MWGMEKGQSRRADGVRRHGPCSTIRAVSWYSGLPRPLKRSESISRIFFVFFNDYGEKNGSMGEKCGPRDPGRRQALI